MLSQSIFNVIFVFPLLNLLVAFYKLFGFLKIPGALGWSILLLTFFIKALTHPFLKKQIESAKKIQELKPKLDKILKKYKNDPKKLHEAQIKLYQEAGVNPAAGCLLPLIQLPVFIALYRSFIIFLNLKKDGAQVFGELNKILYVKFLHLSNIDSMFFIYDLTLSPAKAKTFSYLIIPVITAFLQYWMTKTSSFQMEEGGETSEFQQVFQMQTKILFPLFLGWISYTFPVGLSLYWNFFTLLSIWQMRGLRR